MLYRAKSEGSRSYIKHTYGADVDKPFESNNMKELADSIAYQYYRHCLILYVKDDSCRLFRKANPIEQKQFNKIMSNAFKSDELRRY